MENLEVKKNLGCFPGVSFSTIRLEECVSDALANVLSLDSYSYPMPLDSEGVSEILEYNNMELISFIVNRSFDLIENIPDESVRISIFASDEILLKIEKALFLVGKRTQEGDGLNHIEFYLHNVDSLENYFILRVRHWSSDKYIKVDLNTR